MRPTQPSNRFLAPVMAAVLLLAGCRVPFPVAGQAVPPAGETSRTAADVSRTATLLIRVKWPERDLPGFQAAAIPHTTQTLVVSVSGADRQPVTMAVGRPAGPSTGPVAHAMVIPEGTNLTLEVKAYREAESALAGAVPVAQGSVAGINAPAGERVTVPLTLTAAFAPKITKLSFNGSPGGSYFDSSLVQRPFTLELTGENFGAGNVPVKVTFGGEPVATAGLDRVSDTRLKVNIPANAKTGPVIVEADGIPSTADTIFWVMKNDLPNSPKIRVTYGEGALSINLRVGQTAALAVQESLQYMFPAGKTEADFPTYAASKPVRTYEVSDAAVGKMTGETFSALAAGSATVKARLGWVESNAFAITVATAMRISTVAGSGGSGTDSASSAGLFRPYGVAAGSDGSLLISEWGNLRVRKLAGAGISALAGSGTAGMTDGASASAQFKFPAGVAADASGSLYVADRNNHAVRKVDLSTGAVSTVVGNGTYGFEGDGRPAGEGKLNYPEGVCVTASGDLVIADTFNHKVRMVAAETGSRYGLDMEAGKIYTLAGAMKDGESGFVDSTTGAGARFRYPTGVAAATDGTLYVADSENARVRKIAPDGMVTTAAGTASAGSSGDGGAAVDAQLTKPTAVAVGADGKVFVADRQARRVRAFTPGGNMEAVAGDGTAGTEGDGALATAARLTEPTGLTVAAGALFIVDFGSDRIRRVALSGDDTGKISTVAENAGSAPVDALMVPLKLPFGTAAGSGSFLVVDSGNQVIRRVNFADGKSTVIMGLGSSGFDPPGDGADPRLSRLDDPIWAIYDTAGNLFVADAGNKRVRVVPAASGTVMGVAVTAGIVQTVAGGGSTFNDGAAAVGNLVYRPGGLAFDSNGHLLIVDTGSHRVVRVDKATGAMTTVAGTGNPGYGGDDSEAVAAQLDTPMGVATLAGGHILIADSLNHRIRRVDASSKKISTVAGGGTDSAYGENVAAIKAQLNVPTDIVPDGKGGFYFSDRLNHTIRQVSATGNIFTVAGKQGDAGFAGDAGPALDAKLNLPAGMAMDGAGNLYVADSGNHRIRKLSAD